MVGWLVGDWSVSVIIWVEGLFGLLELKFEFNSYLCDSSVVDWYIGFGK